MPKWGHDLQAACVRPNGGRLSGMASMPPNSPHCGDILSTRSDEPWVIDWASSSKVTLGPTRRNIANQRGLSDGGLGTASHVFTTTL